MKLSALPGRPILLGALTLAGTILPGAVPAAFAQRAAAQDAPATHIAHIENGLLPSAIIKGQPPATMKLTDRMQHYHVPGVSIAFFDHGQIIWTRAYGFADLETRRAVTPDTLFQAGSISKPIAALGALRLVEQGKLHLDTNINDTLTSWHLPDNQYTAEQKVTLRRILSHSAGLTMHGSSGYAAGAPLPTIPQILDGQKPANNEAVRVDTIPGTAFRYSGGGYVIMQLMMTDVTGQGFPTLMHSLVLSPLGMAHSTYQQPLPPNLATNAAVPYDGKGDPIRGGAHTIPEMAVGGLWSTPSDLARAAIEVQQAYSGASHKLLSQPMAHETLTPQIATRGLGFELSPSGTVPRFWHFGVNVGYDSVLQAYRDSGQGIAIMTNGQQGEQLMNEILRAVAREYNWPDFRPAEHALIPIDPTTLLAFTGTYTLPNPDGQDKPDKLTITARNNHLYLAGSYSVGTIYHFTLSDPVELLPTAAQEFFTFSTGATTFRFEKDSSGAIESCIIASGPSQRQAIRIPPSAKQQP